MRGKKMARLNKRRVTSPQRLRHANDIDRDPFNSPNQSNQEKDGQVDETIFEGLGKEKAADRQAEIANLTEENKQHPIKLAGFGPCGEFLTK